MWQLAHSYMRRKEWEAKLQATHTIKLLAEAMGGSKSGTQRMQPNELLQEMGISIE
jgi:hypothetical protein